MGHCKDEISFTHMCMCADVCSICTNKSQWLMVLRNGIIIWFVFALTNSLSLSILL